MITSEQLAEKMKVEIRADMHAGIVPYSVKTFSELHDYVDANCYGGTEALLEELDANSENDDEHTHALNTLCDLMNPAMEIINGWLACGGPHLKSGGETIFQSDTTAIQSISDRAANAANIAAIDHLVNGRYRHIIAWGKWLGFTPEAVLNSVKQAEADDAPEDSIQKINGRWLRIGDIVNDTNRKRVDDLARIPHKEATSM